jgi:thymidylate synthase ThyX
MDDNFSIYVPPYVMNDDMLKEVYEDFEFECKRKYNQTRLLMEDRGIHGEQANDLMRTMLPIGVACNLTMGFTVEALIHFMHKRLCVRADEPIRKVAQLMKQVVLEVEPRYKDFLVPQCQSMMFCPEKHGCNAYPSKDELKVLIDLGKEVKRNK